MRIVSQNKEYDIPYNDCFLSITDLNKVTYYVVASNTLDDVHGIYIGKYSTKEKALKVMKMIRDAYVFEYHYFKMPQDEEV